MALTSGFFNSINHDRRYNAIQISEMFDGIITDGVFKTVGQGMIVKPYDGFRISIMPGRAWFNHTWSLNDAIDLIYIEPSSELQNRIDAVVLEVDTTDQVRKNSFKVIKGESASDDPQKPTLLRTNSGDSDEDDTDLAIGVNQYALAYVRVNAGATIITEADIENAVGTEETPWSSALVETIPADTIMSRWSAQLDDFLRAQQKEVQDWYVAIKDMFEENADTASALLSLESQVTSKQTQHIADSIRLPFGEGSWNSRQNAAGDDEYYCTISLPTLGANDVVQVSPAPNTMKHYGECVIVAAAQNDGSLEFTAEAIPSQEVFANILIWK